MKKLFKTIFIILFITIFACSYSFASNTSNTTEYNKGDVTMKLVEDNVCNIKFGTYGEFEKKLIKYDTNNKTVDIGLTVKNNAEPIIEKNAEVVYFPYTKTTSSTLLRDAIYERVNGK